MKPMSSIRSTRRRDQNIDAAIELLRLVRHRLAADQQRGRELMILAIDFEILVNLRRQFPGRLQDQGSRHARLGASSRQGVDHRQREAGGLAGSGLCDAQHVPPQQHVRNSLLLNGGWADITRLLERAQRLGM
jgi:hypothetical protein